MVPETASMRPIVEFEYFGFVLQTTQPEGKETLISNKKLSFLSIGCNFAAEDQG
jgi:hypothetical protein